MIEASPWNKRPHDVILAPVASEKSARLKDEGEYVFFVDPRASKIETKQAVEAIFDVKVVPVNTQNRQGRACRTRNDIGHRKNTKRAIIPLREDLVNIYDDVVG